MQDQTIDVFVKTPFIERIVSRVLSYVRAGYPVHFRGSTGIGKTAMAFHIASLLERPITVIRGHHEMGNHDLLGHFQGFYRKQIFDNFVRTVYKKEEQVKPLWSNGHLIEAVREGHVLIYDEFTRSRPETNNLFLSIIEERALPLYGGTHKETHIECHPELVLLFTSNPKEYAGVYPTQEALLDRMITIDLSHCDEETEIMILHKKTGLNIEVAECIEEIVGGVRRLCERNGELAPSLRASLMIANMVHAEKLSVQPDDKQFLSVCNDVLAPFLLRCSDLSELEDVDREICKLILGEELS